MNCPKCGYNNKAEAVTCSMCTELLVRASHKLMSAASPSSNAEASTEPIAQRNLDNGRYKWATFTPNLRFPNHCVCCMGPAETNYSVTASRDMETSDGEEVYTKTVSWNFPICRFCSGHANAHSFAWLGAILLGILVSALVAFFSGLIGNVLGGGGAMPDANNGAYIAATIILGGITTALAKTVIAALTVQTGPRCACTSDTVDANNPRGGRYVFWFKNLQYGQLFKEQNSD